MGIVCYSVGMDQVDADAATAAGVPVRNLPTWATQVVAEHAITLLLAAVRRLPVQDRAARTRQGRTGASSPSSEFELFSLQTVGIVGAGLFLGRAFATRARALGFEMIAYTRAPTRTSRDSPS